MSRVLIASVAVLCVFLATTVADGVAQDAASPDPAQTSVADPAAQAKIQQFMEGDSVFIENAGQWPEFIRFALDSRGANVGITDQGPRFQLFRQKPAEASKVSSPTSADTAPETKGPLPDPMSEPPASSEMHEFALVFDGAAVVTPTGRGHSDRKFNYLVGDASKHREGVGSFDAVWYENLYPGISLEMTGRRSGVKYNFHVAPGADWRVLRMRYEGIDGLSLKEDGALEINIAEGWPPLTDGTPYIYQEVNGEKHTVAGRFKLLDGHTYGFEVTGDYDAILPLVIDPEVAWGSYLGGLSNDDSGGIAVDSNGACYVTGMTGSSGWVSGGWNTNLNGAVDGYVVKLTNTGEHAWSTYLGGASSERGYGIAVDGSGACYATGETSSSGWVSGGWSTTYNGGTYDCYVVKLNTAGGHVWSTYLGGTSYDHGEKIAVDSSGTCYVTGTTESSGWVSGGWDTIYGGGTFRSDGFVVKLNSAGGHEWSTYLGGTDYENGYDIGVDSGGACYAAGMTGSSGWVSGGWDVILSDGASTLYDGYVVKLDSAGGHVWSTYLGGAGYDYGYAIAVDSSGACCVTGSTNSIGWVAGGGDISQNGSGDGFVAKLNSAGEHVWSTYLGGTLSDSGSGIALDLGGACYVTGSTNSSGWTNGGWDTSLNGGYDVYVAKFDSQGVHQWSACLGGTNEDSSTDIKVDSSGVNLWVNGRTYSSGWIFNGWDTTHGGGTDAFVVKVAGVNAAGNLQVMITPAEALADGARWRRIGTETWLNSGDTETDVAAGSWSVEFKDIAGWTTPAAMTVEVPLNGTAQATGTYGFIPRGSLQVVITPAEVVAAGAQWRRRGTETWLNSGVTETDVVPISQEIEFKSIEGWVTPAIRSVLIPSGGVATDTGVYYLDLCWSTYLGGTGADCAYGIALDLSGACYATGYTDSSGWVSGGWDASHNGGRDGFIVKMDNAGEHVWSTYVGGTGEDIGHGVAVDSSGTCYATGSTLSDTWVSGGWDTTYNGGTAYGGDGYVVKLNSTGGHLWSTYVGGAEADGGYDIAVDSSGACYVSGSTSSTGWVSGGWDTIDDDGAGRDGYVVKLSSAGGHVWSTYLGEEDTDDGRGIAVDSSGACYVTGSTTSYGWVSGGWDTTRLGIYVDGFLVKLNSAGGHEWSSYVGGLNADYGYDIAVDSSGACFVTGSTASSCWLSGGWDTSLNGSADGFVVKLTTTGEHEWSSYVGGTGNDYGYGIAVDSSDNCYVTGRTASSGWIGGGDGLSGSDDGFIVKLNGLGMHQWSTYLGGTAYDCGWGIAADSSGAYVTGSTESSGWVSEGWQTAYGGNGDAFVVRTKPQDTVGNLQVILTPAEAAAAGARWRRVGTDAWLNSGDTETRILSGLWNIEFKNIEGWAAPGVHAVSIPAEDTATDTGVYVTAVPWDTAWSTYLGGTGRDSGTDIAVDSNGTCYVTGYTASSGWTSGGGNTMYECGAYNAYVVKLNGAGGHEWSTYLDGTGEDEAYSIALDSNGDCYVAGVSVSLVSGSSGFVAKLNSTGGQEWFQENGVDTTYVAVDANNNYYKTVHHNHYLGYPPRYHGHICRNGCSWSTAAADKNYYNLTVGASGSIYVVSEDYNGSYFLEKFSSAGAYLWSTGLNGIEPLDVAVDSSGACYVAGYNSSVYNSDGYLNKYTSGGVLLWSKHWGGTGKETANGLALDGSDNCYVTGLTSSSGWTSGGWDTSLNGGTDGYVVKFNSEGTLLWSSYFGGTSSDDSNGIAVDPTGEFIWVTGLTYSSGTMLNGWQTAYGGNGDAFVAQFQVDVLTPAAPSNPGATAIDLDSITWTWQDNSDDETGFNIYADSGAGPPVTLRATAPADATSWPHDGLSANLRYAFRVCSVNSYGNSAKTVNFTAYTLIEPVAGLVFNASPTSVTVASVNVPSNLAQGASGLQFANTTAGQSSPWQQNAMPWASSGLTPNALYGFSGQSRNGAGVVTTAGTDSTWTLGADPSPGNNILADKTPGVTYLAGTEFNFVNPAGFGPGTHGGSVFMVSAYRYAWNTEAVYVFTGEESTWNAGGLTEAPTVSGAYYLHLQSLNEAGVAGGTLDYGPFVLDLEAPGAPSVSGPALTNNPQPTWAWISGGGGNGTYRYDLDASGVWVETTDITFTPAVGLADGPHLLQVQERDDAGYWSVSGSFEIIVDTIPPVAPLVSGPAFTNNPQPTWTWISGGGGNGTYRYKIDAWAVWAETTEATFTSAVGLGQGSHILQVQERDGVGNWSVSGSFELVVDTTPPASPEVSGPAMTNNPRPTWTWTPGGGGNGNYRYDLDASGVWVETIDVTFTSAIDLEDGTRTLRVQERDYAGNWSADGLFGVLVDTTPPAAPVVSGPAFTNILRPTWTWSSGGGGNGTYRYDLDASGVWEYTLYTTFTPEADVADGVHTLRVQERDNAGNWSAEGSFGVKVDTIPPTAPVVSGPAFTNNLRPTWTWTPGGGGNGTYRHLFDGATEWTETTATSFTPSADLTEARHKLEVQERDDAGNWSAAGLFNLYVDVTPPAAPVVSGPALTNDPTPTWTWTSGGGGNGTYRYDLDTSGVWIETTAVAFTSATDLGDGTHTLRVQERDDAGNWSADGSHGLEINTAALTAAFSLVNPVETAVDSVAFAVTFSADVTPTFDLSAISVTGSLAGTVSIEGTDPDYTVTVTLAEPNADGAVGIAIAGGVVQDAYGNTYAGGTSPKYRIYNWPEPWFTEMPAGARKYTGDDHVFTALANCTAPSLAYQWRWNDGAKAEHAGPASSSWTLSGLTPGLSGSYWCEATYDGMTHATPPVTLQVVEPLEIVTPPSGGTRIEGDTHEFSVSVSGGYDPLHYQWRKDGTVIPEAPDSSSWTLTNLTEGHSGSYTVVVTDDNGMSVESLPAALVVESGLAGPNAVLLAALILLIALFGGALLRHVVTR